jgi:hypothetical protein
MMEERIKELAVQAGLRFTQLMSNPMVPVVDGKETDLEKFAELIVRECAEICMIEYDTGLDMAPQAPWIAKQIKDHFGIK